ncbi:hypothetical protein B0H13DRAFT_2679788 [Mycena leptocephala]|nr:hypothetical protein B0H13DRAFT_2679788 [Mycena leptocephala]
MEEHGESQAYTAALTTPAWQRWTPRRFAPFPFSRRPPRVPDSLRCEEDAPGGWPSVRGGGKCARAALLTQLQGVDVWDLPTLLLRVRVCVGVRSQPRFVARRMRRRKEGGSKTLQVGLCTRAATHTSRPGRAREEGTEPTGDEGGAAAGADPDAGAAVVHLSRNVVDGWVGSASQHIAARPAPQSAAPSLCPSAMGMFRATLSPPAVVSCLRSPFSAVSSIGLGLLTDFSSTEPLFRVVCYLPPSSPPLPAHSLRRCWGTSTHARSVRTTLHFVECARALPSRCSTSVPDHERLIGDAAKYQVAMNPTSIDLLSAGEHEALPFTVFSKGGKPYIRVEYRGEQNEFLCHNLFRSALKPVEKVLRDSKIDKANVHKIEPNKSINPDEAVAYIQPAILSGDISEKTQDLEDSPSAEEVD